MKYLKFDYKLSIFLIATFIIMTVVGTLTHELGHYTVARLLGYQASINYQSSSYYNKDVNKFLKEKYNKHPNEIKNNLNFPEKEKYIKTIAKYKRDSFWITLGGPLQTILTGSIAFILLIVYRKKVIVNDRVNIKSWVLIFFSLFWLRQAANLFMGIMIYLIKGRVSTRGDEIRLAHYLDINIWTIEIISGLIAIVVFIQVLRLLPHKIVLTFLISGLIGGVLGYYLWLIKYGEIIMP